MILITDSNIIFSALMNPNGSLSEIFKTKSRLQFIAPAVLIDEIRNHFDKIANFSSLPMNELREELEAILSKIKVVENNHVPKKYIVEAVKIVADIDYDDAFFVALHLYKKHKIWTSDKVLINGLEKKGYFICITTAEVRTHLYKK